LPLCMAGEPRIHECSLSRDEHAFGDGYLFVYRRKTVTKRDAIFPAGRQALYELNRYSAAIRSGDLLFVSGQVGSRENGAPEPDFAKQVQLAFDNLKAVLTAAGATFDDVIDVTTFHTDPEAQWSTISGIRMKEIGEAPYPNWTAVGVNWLAGFDFEIKVIARLPQAA
jgi:enamine deaminase RidA (YjgF/YER057c/UK114 family)